MRWIRLSPLFVGVLLAAVGCTSTPSFESTARFGRTAVSRRLKLSGVLQEYFRRYPIASTAFVPSPSDPGNGERAREVSQSFTYSVPPRELFARWMALTPKQMWGGPTSFFELLLVPTRDGYAFYDSQANRYPPLQEGMLLFLRLEPDVSLELPVAFDITKIDRRKLIFQIAYLKQNASGGSQTLYFRPNSTGGTTLIQVSHFYSKSRLRDSIYPVFHRRLVDDFQRHMHEITGK